MVLRGFVPLAIGAALECAPAAQLQSSMPAAACWRSWRRVMAMSGDVLASARQLMQPAQIHLDILGAADRKQQRLRRRIADLEYGTSECGRLGVV